MLAETEIEALWKAFLEHQSVYYVAKRCKVAPATVRNYRRLRAWDARLQQIQAKACALADQQAAQPAARKSDDGSSYSYHVMKILDALDEQLEAGTYTPNVSAVPTIMSALPFDFIWSKISYLLVTNPYASSVVRWYKASFPVDSIVTP